MFISTLSPEPIDLRTRVSVCVWVMTLVRGGLEVNVVGQGQKLGL